MSWEDCGFKPGIINGPAKCPKGQCGDCDGDHHFYASYEDVEDETEDPNFEPAMFFECKHCGTRATMIPEDGPDDEEMAAQAKAHDDLYGEEEREMELKRKEEREDGQLGFWDGMGWHDYEIV
jgi:hypothetical protein